MNDSPPDRGFTLAPLLRRAGSVIESEIRGSSMNSTLPDGTPIRIHCRAEDDYRPGTVIAFVIPGGLVGHRLLAVTHGRDGEALYFTRGDGTVVADGPVETKRVLGEVTEWFDGRSWCPVPAAPPLGAGRRVAAGMVLYLIRISAVLSIAASAWLSRLLLRVAHRRLPSAPSAGAP